jgi:hypothetical protein
LKQGSKNGFFQLWLAFGSNRADNASRNWPKFFGSFFSRKNCFLLPQRG